jgi:hypothetical protein
MENKYCKAIGTFLAVTSPIHSRYSSPFTTIVYLQYILRRTFCAMSSAFPNLSTLTRHYAHNSKESFLTNREIPIQCLFGHDARGYDHRRRNPAPRVLTCACLCHILRGKLQIALGRRTHQIRPPPPPPPLPSPPLDEQEIAGKSASFSPQILNFLLEQFLTARRRHGDF